MEIRRFGIGHRRHEGPAGTHGVDGQSIHSDERGVIAELAFRPNAAMAPHTNPNLTYFVVIEGGGFVIVGDERARVAAGEAVVWPPNVVRAAWTELTPMRALVIEFAPEQAATLRLGEGPGRPAVSAGAKTPPDLGPTDGGLVTTPSQPPTDRESPGREPW